MPTIRAISNFFINFFHVLFKLLSQSPQKRDDQGKFQNDYRRPYELF